jgi:hypothetical protein
MLAWEEEEEERSGLFCLPIVFTNEGKW